MSSDHTEQQSDQQWRSSQELSLERKRPPSSLPGYEFQRHLGSGAYGEVWVAIDKNTGRHVAVKFYAHRGGLDSSLLSREVEKLVFLSADRYVVQLLDVGWEADPPYYVMEYIENGSLEDYLNQQGTLDVREAVELFTEVAVGLTHAHGKGILHCDLKPANVLLDQDHKPRLADFGQSRLSHEQSPSLGTLFYMAPEQADLNAMPDARWDVYALGVLFYSMLTGEPPFRQEQAISRINNAVDLSDRLACYRKEITSAPPPTAHRKIRGMDKALINIIDRSIAVDPRKRFANVQEVVDSLRARDQARARRPLLTLGLVGPALLLIIMTLFGWRGYAQAVGDTDLAVTKRTKQTNSFAARFVSGLVAREIDLYYRAVEKVAQDPEFQQLFLASIQDPELSTLLSKLENPAKNSLAVEEIRPQYIQHEARRAIQQYVGKLLVDPQLPQAASWFITNSTGMQIASVFDSTTAQSTLGKYYGWRTYFHGGPADFPKDQRVSSDQHITKTHLSAILKSTATNTLKLAVSTPIMSEGKFMGVIALTVEVGRFMNFDGNESQFAVLVDGREGDYKGLILQHPLFDKMLRKYHKLPDRFGDYRLPMDKRISGQVEIVTRYRDPLGADKEGKEYDKQWIAAKAVVLLPKNRGDANGKPSVEESGLIVLVQEDYQKATAAVHRLGKRLVREGLFALGVVIAVLTLLWYFVVQGVGDTSGASPFSHSGQSEPTPVEEMPTLMAQPRTK